MPAIWEGPYTYAYKLFNAAVISHYAGVSFASNIRYVRFGLSIGGEASTACMSSANGFESLLTPSSDAQIKTMWTTTATASYADNVAKWTTSAPAWYLMSTINMGSGLTSGTDQTWAIAEANGILANQPYAIGSQSLENGVPSPGTTLASDLFNINNGASCSGNNCCADNWCNARPITVGSVPLIELQDCNISKAAGGNTGCLSSSLAKTAADDSPTLSQVFVLASQHATNVQEIYFNDLLCAFDPSDSRVPPSTCTSAVSNAYSSAILALSVGQPSGTGSMFGNKATILGGAAIF